MRTEAGAKDVECCNLLDHIERVLAVRARVFLYGQKAGKRDLLRAGNPHVTAGQGIGGGKSRREQRARAMKSHQGAVFTEISRTSMSGAFVMSAVSSGVHLIALSAVCW